MNEIMLREPLFSDQSGKSSRKTPGAPQHRAQSWSVASIVTAPLHGLQRAFASSGEPETHEV